MGKHNKADSMVKNDKRSKEVDKFIANLNPPFSEITKILRDLVFEMEPKMEEKIKWKRPVYSLNGDVCYIGVFKKHIDFGFFNGVKLSDPKGILEGAGVCLRYVKIHDKKDIQEKQFKAFVKEAVKLNKMQKPKGRIIKNDWTREELEREYVSKMTAVTVPVNVSFSGKQKILEMKELEDILKNAEVIAKTDCYCRKRMGNCIEPMDGCLTLDEEATEDIKRGDAKPITVDEALSAMKRTYDAGLVHMAYTDEGKDKIGIICSCCSCCCHSLSAALRFGYSDHVFSSNFIATLDSDTCISCGLCVDRCQFQAREMVDGKLAYSEDKCFGCGLCLENCPEDAIEMIERT
jgi:NAD-dependent dihydropyrimidine dehydrogenase PreA subunit